MEKHQLGLLFGGGRERGGVGGGRGQGAGGLAQARRHTRSGNEAASPGRRPGGLSQAEGGAGGHEEQLPGRLARAAAAAAAGRRGEEPAGPSGKAEK